MTDLEKAQELFHKHNISHNMKYHEDDDVYSMTFLGDTTIILPGNTRIRVCSSLERITPDGYNICHIYFNADGSSKGKGVWK